jgi:hypothetical protein
MTDETPPKQESKIAKYFLSKMSPEEKKAYYDNLSKIRSAAFARKREEKAALREKAKEMLPELAAQRIMQEEMNDENWIPKQETIDKLKMFMKKDLSSDKVREKYFPTIKDDHWHKLMKFVFKSSVANVEDLGADIIAVKRKSIETLKKQIREYKKEIKAYKEEKKTRCSPISLLNMIKECQDKLLDIELDVSKTLFQVGAVGEKSRSPSLHLHLGTPRPKKEEKEVIINGD